MNTRLWDRDWVIDQWKMYYQHHMENKDKLSSVSFAVFCINKIKDAERKKNGFGQR